MSNQTTITLYRYVKRYPATDSASDYFGDWNDDARQTAHVVAYGNAHLSDWDAGAYWTIETKEILTILA